MHMNIWSFSKTTNFKIAYFNKYALFIKQTIFKSLLKLYRYLTHFKILHKIQNIL